MSETENLQSASEPKTNGDEASYASEDSNTVKAKDDREEQTELNTSGDTDMLDADWVVQDEVHSDDSDVTTNGDLTEKTNNADEDKVTEATPDAQEIPEKNNELNSNSIEAMDIDLDKNVSDNSVIVQEEEEAALLEDETETKETTSEDSVSVTENRENNQSEVAEVNNVDVEDKDLVASETDSEVIEKVTSSSGIEDKSDDNEEKMSVASVKDDKCNMSDVISLDEETMSETEKPDSTLIEDPQKSINIDDDDDDIMLVDDDVVNIEEIDRVPKIKDESNKDKESKDVGFEDNQKLKSEDSNVSTVDEKLQIDKVAIIGKDVGSHDVVEIHKVDEESNEKSKTEDQANIDNVRIDDEVDINDVRNDEEPNISDTSSNEAIIGNQINKNDSESNIIEDVRINNEAKNGIVEIDEKEVNVVDDTERKIADKNEIVTAKLHENNKMDDISEIDDVEVIKKNNSQIDGEVNILDELKIKETIKVDELEKPCEEGKMDEVLDISEDVNVGDEPVTDKTEKGTKCDDERKTESVNVYKAPPESKDIEELADPEQKMESGIPDDPCETNVIPSDCDVPLNSMVEGLDEKTIIFIDDAVKSGFKKILISDESVQKKTLIQKNFIKTFSKKLSDMTRNDLEEFCLLKIVEGIVERSSLSDATSKLKNLMQHVDEWRKKAQQLQKQNRDLSVVLRNIQEEHRKRAHGVVTPLKITRSVGLQVAIPTNNNNQNNQNIPNVPTAETKPPKQKRGQGKPNTNRNQKQAKTTAKSVQKIVPPKPSASNVPVPRLVPVSSSPPKLSQFKNASSVTNGTNTTPTKAEKRPLSELNNSIDLTDDEPPSKQMAVTSPSNVMRLVNPGQPGGGQRMAFMVNSPLGFGSASPRQVYIPISGQGAQGAIRPGQTLMFSGTGPRSKLPSQINPPPLLRTKDFNEPALPPLPGSYRQMHMPNWKWIPPSPELKISRVDTESTSIVISWMLKDFDETKHEKVVSYQIYAYHESNARVTSSASWIKIGDVKALPLPMACTLSQFKMQNKYHFVVRGVDAKSRVGPFSPPGSIVLVKHPTKAINGINK